MATSAIFAYSGSSSNGLSTPVRFSTLRNCPRWAKRRCSGDRDSTSDAIHFTKDRRGAGRPSRTHRREANASKMRQNSVASSSPDHVVRRF